MRFVVTTLLGEQSSEARGGAQFPRFGALLPRNLNCALKATGRQLVADQLAAAPGENRRTFDQARAVLLVAAGGESSDAPALRKHAEEDCGAAGAGGLFLLKSVGRGAPPIKLPLANFTAHIVTEITSPTIRRSPCGGDEPCQTCQRPRPYRCPNSHRRSNLPARSVPVLHPHLRDQNKNRLA